MKIIEIPIGYNREKIISLALYFNSKDWTRDYDAIDWIEWVNIHRN